MSKKTTKSKTTKAKDTQEIAATDTQASASATATPKVERKDVKKEHRETALANARKAGSGVENMLSPVLMGIEAGKDMSESFKALKAQVDALSKAINQLGLHAKPAEEKGKAKG